MWDPALKCPLKCTVGVYHFSVIWPSCLCLHNFIQLFLFCFSFFFFNKWLEPGNPQLGSYCEYDEPTILLLVPSVLCIGRAASGDFTWLRAQPGDAAWCWHHTQGSLSGPVCAFVHESAFPSLPLPPKGNRLQTE